MKIILLTSSLNSGGAERVATTLCNAWAARGNEITLIPTFSGGGNPFYSVDARVNLKYLAAEVMTGGQNRTSGKNHFKRLWALRRMIVDSRPDVVIAFLPNVSVAAILATSFTGIPCIACERSDPLAQPIGSFWSTACKILYRFADAVTVQTESVAQRIETIYPNLQRIAVMPNPLPDELLAIPPKEYRVVNSSERRTLISVGRLSSEKRPDRIIEAFARIADRHPEWDLKMVGDGPMRATLEKLVRDCRLADGRVRLVGRTSNPWPIMKDADAFILASAYEGFPNALLEAMALGVPSISTDCNSGPREISENGTLATLVTSDDDDALSNSLDKFLANSELRKILSESGSKSVRQRFNLDAVLKHWDQLIQGLAHTRMDRHQ